MDKVEKFMVYLMGGGAGAYAYDVLLKVIENDAFGAVIDCMCVVAYSFYAYLWGRD